MIYRRSWSANASRHRVKDNTGGLVDAVVRKSVSRHRSTSLHWANLLIAPPAGFFLQWLAVFFFLSVCLHCVLHCFPVCSILMIKYICVIKSCSAFLSFAPQFHLFVPSFDLYLQTCIVCIPYSCFHALESYIVFCHGQSCSFTPRMEQTFPYKLLERARIHDRYARGKEIWVKKKKKQGAQFAIRKDKETDASGYERDVCCKTIGRKEAFTLWVTERLGWFIDCHWLQEDNQKRQRRKTLTRPMNGSFRHNRPQQQATV